MKDSKNNRVILVNGDNSKWYEQAIFIVKKNTLEKNIPVDFVAEAEKVVNSYIHKTSSKARARTEPIRKTRQGAETLINALILATCGLLVLMLVFLL